MKHFILSLFCLAVSFPLFADEPNGPGVPFDGQTGYRVDSGQLKFDGVNVSVSAWVRAKTPDKVENSMQVFISFGESIMDEFKLYLNNRKPPRVRMQVEYAKESKPGVGKTYLFAGAPLPEAGKWTHYLGTYDGKTITIYKNGKKEDEKAAPTQRDSFGSPTCTLGAVPELPHYLAGSLEDIRIWNRTLGADEAALVAEGKSIEKGLISRWNSDGLHSEKWNNTLEGAPVAVRFDKFVKKDDSKAATAPILLNGKPLEFFDPQKREYKVYLPHGTRNVPKVEISSGVKGSVSGTNSDKQVTVSIDDPKQGQYRIRFETLPELDLFFCIGQSNMAGRGPMDASRGDLEPLENVYLFTPAGNWEIASNPLNKYSSVRKPIEVQQISPPYGFAKKLSKRTGRPIGLVMNPRGGTTIEEWTKGNKGEFDLYAQAMKRALEAKPWGKFKAILWHQGEGNSGRAAAYPDQLKKLVADLRKDLGDENLFFVAGELGTWRKKNGVESNQSFNRMIREIKTFVDHSDVVSAEGLTPLRGDVNDPHFDRESQLILGERYADSVLKAVYGKDK